MHACRAARVPLAFALSLVTVASSGLVAQTAARGGAAPAAMSPSRTTSSRTTPSRTSSSRVAALPQDAHARARALLAALVATNTTLSSGATTAAAEMLAARFRAAGFPAADVMVAGANAKQKNVVLRWRGKDRALEPILFNAHMDVVEAPTLEWSTPPFQLTEKDGYLYGRGVLDDKGSAAAIAAAFIDARARGVQPERDLVLALTAGEETGVGNGVEWLLANRRPLVHAEFALVLDAGGGEMAGDTIKAYAMQAAEKVYLDVELVARGPGGHSSLPGGETPIDLLARALGRIGRYQFPVRLNPVVRAFFEARAAGTGGEIGRAMSAIVREADDLAAQNVLVRDRHMNALLRTTCIATMLRGGTAPNAIPQEAAATINCRILPGESPESVIATLKREAADTSLLLRTLAPALASPPSPLTPAIRALVARALAPVAPGIPIVPYMESGGTDAVYLRNAGIPAYGTSGMFVSADDENRMHGRDERISVQAFRRMVQFSEALLAAAGNYAMRPGELSRTTPPQ